MNWNKRKKLLKEKEWEYTRDSLVEGVTGAWISDGGDIHFTFELKEMNDEEFSELLENS